ncbi:MAG: SMP-30/gluconolactonase/LRE family protein [Planctomycetales bacterium]|nr:SMP-30/gluconolactonase/LRE family protein [Planctomycetales bacterium]
MIACLSRPAFSQDMALSGVLIDDEGWQLVAEGFKFTEGPAVDADGRVYFTDIPNNRIHKTELDGKVSVFVENSQRTNGLMFGRDGKLYGCQAGTKRVVAFDSKGEPTTVAEEIEGNDLVVNGNGGIYVTEPPKNRVWYISPTREKRIVAEGFRPNGVILWGDEGTLVVTDSDAPHLWTFRVEPDGNLTCKERYYHPLQIPSGRDKPGSDGMTVDAQGRLYVATAAGLQMFDPTGRLGGTILKPQPGSLSNACFGGPKLDTLYVTAGDKVFRRKTQATGVRYGAKK